MESRRVERESVNASGVVGANVLEVGVVGGDMVVGDGKGGGDRWWG